MANVPAAPAAPDAPNVPEPAYLGDGVYVSFDWHHVVLSTGSHNLREAENVVYLDMEVLSSLDEWVARLRKALQS